MLNRTPRNLRDFAVSDRGCDAMLVIAGAVDRCSRHPCDSSLANPETAQLM
jgi:hypothetical protein